MPIIISGSGGTTTISGSGATVSGSDGATTYGSGSVSGSTTFQDVTTFSGSIYQSGSGNTVYFLDNVGIGTTAPLHTLSVTGTLGVSSYITASSGIHIPQYQFIEFGTGSLHRINESPAGLSISGSHINFDSSHNISLDAADGVWSFAEAGVNRFTISSGTVPATAGTTVIKPSISGHWLSLATQAGNLAAAVDGTNDGFRIERKMILGSDSSAITLTHAAQTIPLTTVSSIIYATGSVDVTGTLADSTFQGQLKIVIGLYAPGQDGRPAVTYNNLVGSVTKDITAQTGLLLLSVYNGAGGYKWVTLGDTS